MCLIASSSPLLQGNSDWSAEILPGAQWLLFHDHLYLLFGPRCCLFPSSSCHNSQRDCANMHSGHQFCSLHPSGASHKGGGPADALVYVNLKKLAAFISCNCWSSASCHDNTVHDQHMSVHVLQAKNKRLSPLDKWCNEDGVVLPGDCEAHPDMRMTYMWSWSVQPEPCLS